MAVTKTNNLKYGSKGEDVIELQKALNSKGANLEEDGSYGPATQAAVKQYQKNNGLTVDGIVGTNTWGHLQNAVQSTAPSQPAVQETAQPQAAPSYRYNAGEDQVYQQALQQLQASKANAPTYAGTFDEQLKAIYDKIMNREDFSYDLNGDALWNQYKDQHTQQGRLSMMDTMGQASALTGGYGSSYAQQVGQQAYNQHLQQLSEKVPELYQLARSMYDAEGNRLAEQFALTGELAGDEYTKHQDALDRYWQNVDRAQAEADTAYERGESS